MGAKIIYKKIFMQQIEISDSSFLLQHYQSVKANLLQVKDIKSFFKCMHKCLKAVVQKSVNNSDWLSLLQMIEKNYYVSILNEQEFKDQNVADIRMFIRQKYGYVFCLIAEFVARLIILDSIIIKSKDFFKTQAQHYRDAMVDNFQKLRFQIQIENIIRMNEGKNILQYQEIIQCTIENILKKDITQQAMRIIYEVMKEENANIPRIFQERVQSMIKRGQNQKKNKNEKNTQQKFHKQKDLVLKIIKKKEEELKMKRKQNTQQQNKPSMKEAFSITHPNFYKKEKIIHKTRTIYHQRKNLYIPRKKRQRYYAQMTQKSIDKSTQWSFTFELFKKPTARNINQDFQDDFLVGKTPKPQRLLSLRNPISFRLDFSN